MTSFEARVEAMEEETGELRRALAESLKLQSRWVTPARAAYLTGYDLEAIGIPSVRPDAGSRGAAALAAMASAGEPTGSRAADGG